jgi:hypothetical protein
MVRSGEVVEYLVGSPNLALGRESSMILLWIQWRRNRVRSVGQLDLWGVSTC